MKKLTIEELLQSKKITQSIFRQVDVSNNNVNQAEE